MVNSSMLTNQQRDGHATAHTCGCGFDSSSGLVKEGKGFCSVFFLLATRCRYLELLEKQVQLQDGDLFGGVLQALLTQPSTQSAKRMAAVHNGQEHEKYQTPAS